MDSIAPGGMDLLSVGRFGDMKSAGGVFEPGDVLYGRMRPYLNKVHLAKQRGACSAEFIVVPPGPSVRGDFLSYLIHQRSFVNFASEQSSGDRPRVDFESLGSFEFGLPPKPEQQRIVSRIEELFSEIDEGERALERVGQLVERYRQSVLKAAVTGELTREWREARQESMDPRPEVRVLGAHREHCLSAPRAGLDAEARNPSRAKRLERYELPEPPKVLPPGWLPAGWAWVTVAHVAECLDYARVPVSAKEREKRVGNVPYFGANGQVGFIDQHLFDELLVLVVEDETFTGRTKPFSYLVAGKCWVNNHAHVLRPTSAINVRFLNAVLMHYPFIPLTTGTTARRKLTQKALMAAPLAVPPLDEQLAIVDLLDAQLSVIESTSAEAGRARPHATALRQSILKAAFSGQLVPQDPRDEPASALLARLTAQSAEALPAPKRRSRKVPA
jgi:type I restriction enzyme S subunit